MRRTLSLLIASVAFLTLGSGVANAENQTVDGTGDITKMTVRNRVNDLTTTVFGLGPRCGGAQHLQLEVKNSNSRLLYKVESGCTSGEWHAGLYYFPDGASGLGRLVTCAGFSMTRTASTGAYRIEVPRSCLRHAPDRVKVRADGQNYGTLTGGRAGPTRVLARG